MTAIGRLHKVLPTAVGRQRDAPVDHAARAGGARRRGDRHAALGGRQSRRADRRRSGRPRRSSRSRRAASSLLSAAASVSAIATSSAITPARSIICSRRRRAERTDVSGCPAGSGGRPASALCSYMYAGRQSRLLRAVAKRHAQAPRVDVRHAVAATASRGASSPARPSRRRSRRRARVQAQGLLLTLDYLGESVRTIDGSRRRHARVRPAARRDRRIRHRAEHLAEADAARRRRRPRDVRRQSAAHPRAGRPPRILRAHRHGELAVDAADARCLRDAVAAGVPQHRHRAAGGAAPHRTGRAPDERAWRARPAGQGRVQRTGRRSRISERRTSTRRSSGSCSCCSTAARIRPSPRTTRR